MEFLLAFSIGHDSNAFVLNDGGEWAYENAERVDRLKQSSDYQVAINNVISRGGCRTQDIKMVAITTTQNGIIPILNEKKFNIKSWNSQGFTYLKNKGFDNLIRNHLDKWIPYHKNITTVHSPAIYINEKEADKLKKIRDGDVRITTDSLIAKGICSFYGENIPCFHVEHHFAHICSALIRHSKANICISMDGSSGVLSHLFQFPFWGGLSAAINKNNEIVFAPPPLFTGGIMYTKIAKELGLTEGKMMGLAGYFSKKKNVNKTTEKNWEKCLESLKNAFDIDRIKLHSGSSPGNQDLIDGIDEQSKSKVKEVLNDIRNISIDIANSIPLDLHKNSPSMPTLGDIAIAGAAQKIFTEMRIDAVNKQIKFFENQDIICDGIVFTGGCTLNCPSNNLLVNTLSPYKLFFDNACNDEGLSIGAAHALKISGIQQKYEIKSINTPFLGSSVTSLEEALEIADKQGFEVLKIVNHEDAILKVATKIAAGEIAILCHGRYEAGPRALGNRSLIAKSTDRKYHFLLNKIKQREVWRPIAPMCRDQDFDTYFTGPREPNMLMTNHVKIPDLVPAVTHYDLTARVQVISDRGMFAYKLMTQLNNLEICPVLANTSLNQNNEPLINSAARAIDLMRSHAEITAVYFGEYLVVSDRNF